MATSPADVATVAGRRRETTGHPASTAGAGARRCVEALCPRGEPGRRDEAAMCIGTSQIRSGDGTERARCRATKTGARRRRPRVDDAGVDPERSRTRAVHPWVHSDVHDSVSQSVCSRFGSRTPRFVDGRHVSSMGATFRRWAARFVDGRHVSSMGATFRRRQRTHHSASAHRLGKAGRGG